jgi:hypothetical protein
MTQPSVSEEMIRAAYKRGATWWSENGQEMPEYLEKASADYADKTLAHLPAGSEAVKPTGPVHETLNWPLKGYPDDYVIHCEVVQTGYPPKKHATFGYTVGEYRAALAAPPFTPPAANVQEGNVEAQIDAIVKLLESRATYFDRNKGHFDRTDAANSYRATAKEIATMPRSKQAPTVAVPDEGAVLKALGEGRYDDVVLTSARAEQRETPSAVVGEGWTKKSKGSAKIYRHPNVERAVVRNPSGVTWNGLRFETVEQAQAAALAAAPTSDGR